MQVTEDILYVDLISDIIPVSVSDILYIDFGSPKCIVHLNNGTVLYEKKTRSQTVQALIQKTIQSMFVWGMEGFMLDNVIWKDLESGVPFWWSGNGTFPVHIQNDSGEYTAYLSKRAMGNLIHMADKILNKQIPYLKEYLQVFRKRISLNDLMKIEFDYSACDATDRDNNHYQISYPDACGIISYWNQIKILPGNYYMIQKVVNLNVVDWESTINLGLSYNRDNEKIYWLIDRQKNRLAQYIKKELADTADILSGTRLSKEFCCAHSNYCKQLGGNNILFNYQNQEFWSIWGESSLADWESETGMRKPLADKSEYLLNPDMIDWEKCRVYNDITTPVLRSLGYRRTLYFKDGAELSVSPEEYAAQAAAAAIPGNGVSTDTVYDETHKISFHVSDNLLMYFPNITDPVNLIMLKNGYIGQVPTSWDSSFEEGTFISGLNKCGCKLHEISVLKIDSEGKCKSVPVYININVIDLDDKHWFSSVRIAKPDNPDNILKKLENVYRLVSRDGKVFPDIWIPGEEWEKLKEVQSETCR